MLGMVVAIAFGAHMPMPEAALATSYEATANLNIRSAPDVSSPIVGRIPSGATVEVTGEIQDNFYPVAYNGVSGFASADYLSLPGGGNEDDGGGVANGPTGTWYVGDARLNLRSGPGASYGVIVIMPAGAPVTLTGETSNGFSELTYNGQTGWAATTFLTASGGVTQPTPTTQAPTTTPAAPTTTSTPQVPSIGDTPIGTATVNTVGVSLNMRSGPGVSFGIVRSLPSGAQVELMGDSQNGFRPARYQGAKGWASAEYLRIGAAATPVTPTATPMTPTVTAPATSQPGGGTVGDTVVGSATVTTVGMSLNMRSGPGTTFGVIRSIPSGAQVEVMGAAQGGFLPVRYQGTEGWASAEYLRVGSSGTPAAPTATATATATPVTPTATATAPATPDGNATGSGTVTAARLNFRTGPGTSSPVIGVLTVGTRVEITGSAQNGFLPIRAQGTSGWAAQEYIGTGPAATPTATATPATPTPVTPTPTASATPSPTTPPGGVSGTAVISVSGTLNMRSGPGTQYPVIRGLANGSQVDLLGAAQNGFRPIRYGGTDGWASEAYLEIGATNPSGPSEPNVPAIGNAAVGKATMNASVSLRRGPATSYGHIQTLNNGWKVEIMGEPVNGWTPIRYNAAKGWVPSGNLTPGWGYQIVDQMITSRSQRLMSQPGGGTLVFWVPPGTLVDITGPAQGIYVPASWAGYRGWLDSTLMYQPEDFVEPGPKSARDAEMISIIYQAADKWGQSRVDMLRVARCESFLDPNIVNPASGTSGLFQFRPSTFAFTPNGKRGENIFDPWSNADAAGWMWANGMRHHWACQ